MKKILHADALYGVILTLAILFLYSGQSSFLETIELKFYDIRSASRIPDNPAKEIALVTIDNDSLGKLGRWPWPRSRMAQLLDFLSQEANRPKVIGLDILFSEPEQNLGLQATQQIRGVYEQNLAAKENILKEHAKLNQKAKLAKASAWTLDKIYSLWKQSVENDQKVLADIDGLQSGMDNDAKLATAIKTAGNVVLPLFLHLGEGVGAKPPALSNAIGKSMLMTMRSADSQGLAALGAFEATVPLETLAAAAAASGHVNTVTDSDGAVRKEALAVAYGDSMVPSFALQLAMRFLDQTSEQAVVAPGSTLEIAGQKIPLDEQSSLALTYNGPEKTFPHYSFFDVIEGKVQAEAFKNKIVIVGPTASGVGSSYVTPVANNFPGIEIIANAVDNLLYKRYLVRPSWSFMAELFLIVLTGVFVSFLLPKLKATGGALTSLGILCVLMVAGTYLFVAGQWLKVTYPAILLVAGYTIIVSKRFLVTEKKKELVEGESIETNKMLGLSFQGQGMLDLAFEKFRKIPVDDTVKDLLYNLALDFERKRQFNKAVAVYEHIASKDAKYKDIRQKIENLKKAAQGFVSGGIGGKSKDSTVMMEGSSVAATLGRYEIVKELGKGAMGIVYLGRDPKINRQVAIKTMRFEDDIDEASMKAVKERFFREAESAGNLSHPNIVKIYDAGDEQDISYIAMELLEGEDLKIYASKDSLLPMPKVIEYAALVADALAYAHKQGIVHRDIKPANIMLLKDGNVRVTDFGIARITASSKTATGTVLGTPSYMSPEQISGKKVDGRADLFSLGVCLYELLTGEKPWKGGDSIGTLLFQIANDPYPDPVAIRKDIPPGIMPIIDKALQKDPEKRYQSGDEMARDLRNLQSTGASPKPPEATTTKPPAAKESTTPKIEPPKPIANTIEKTVVLPQATPATPKAEQTMERTMEKPANDPKPVETKTAEPKKEPSKPDKKTMSLDDFEKTLPIIAPPGD
ncbi:MAG: CHASE2 domain-containing protein [Elusimicrobiota bacterium]